MVYEVYLHKTVRKEEEEEEGGEEEGEEEVAIAGAVTVVSV